MLTNVNLRKLSYAVTPAGISELSLRSQKFAKRTFEMANRYNESLCKAVEEAKNQGKTKVVLYGNSYIKFLLVYACQTLGVGFVEKSLEDSIENDALCIVGELNEDSDIERLKSKGCVSLLDFLEK